MARSYDELSKKWRAGLSPDAADDLAVHERAYSLALQIMDLRKKHGLTQAQLADRCGVDQADISRIERGVIRPTEITLSRIADALDADLRLVERKPA